MPFDAGMVGLDIPQHFAFFPDVFATQIQPTLNSLRRFAAIFAETSQVDEKRDLPLFAAAVFGNKRDPKSGSYRTRANLVLNSAVVIDYDGGDPDWLERVKAKCIEKGVAALFYSSASYTPEHPKWRVIFPVVELHDVDEYQRLVAKIDIGLMDGTAAPESYDPTRSYFFTSVNGRSAPIVVMIEGGTIDFANSFTTPEQEDDILREKRKTKQTTALPPAELEADRTYIVPVDTQTELLDRMARRLAKAPDGQKHKKLLAVARHVGGIRRKLDLSDQAIIDVLIDYLRQSASPIADEDHARRTALVGLQTGGTEPLAILPVLDSFGLGTAFRGHRINTEGLAPPPSAPPSPPPAEKIEFMDPLEDRLPPRMPSGVFAPWMEEMVERLALRDGVCPSVLYMAYLAATSGAMSKASRFSPYRVLRYKDAAEPSLGALFNTQFEEALWSVPPVIWVMVIAESGQRKTRAGDLAFGVLKHLRTVAFGEYQRALDAYNAETREQKAFLKQPLKPMNTLLDDCTIEYIQEVLAKTRRGAILYRDELASLFGFGRYGSGSSVSERASYLETYEGESHNTGRISREAFTTCNALSIYGNIQPEKLREFKDLASDGFMQRFNVILASKVETAQPDMAVTGVEQIDAKLEALTKVEAMKYSTTFDGAKLIKEIEAHGQAVAEIKDHGPGFQGAMSKLHGFTARYAMILHALDDPTNPVIPTDTVRRAVHLTKSFLQPQILHFYEKGIRSTHHVTLNIAKWILNSAKERITQSDLKSHIHSCRELASKELSEAMDMIGTWGWVTPVGNYGTSRVWTVAPGLREHFKGRIEDERARHKRHQKIIDDIRAGAGK